MSKRKTARRGREYWTKLIGEYEGRANQETHEAFAERKRINVETFRNWLYKVRNARTGQPVRFVEVNPDGDVARASRDVVVELGGGRYTIWFEGGVEAAWIGDVVEALAARLDC